MHICCVCVCVGRLGKRAVNACLCVYYIYITCLFLNCEFLNDFKFCSRTPRVVKKINCASDIYLQEEVSKLINMMLGEREREIIQLYYGLENECLTWEDISKR